MGFSAKSAWFIGAVVLCSLAVAFALLQNQRSRDAEQEIVIAVSPNQQPFSTNGATNGAPSAPASMPLYVALKSQNLRRFQALLGSGADPNAITPSGDSVMHLAAETEEPAFLIEAIAAGGDANLQSRIWINPTPLHSSITFVSQATDRIRVEILLDAGADIYFAREDGVTPLEAAVHSSRFDLAHLLIERGALKNLSFEELDELKALMQETGARLNKQHEMHDWYESAVDLTSSSSAL